MHTFVETKEVKKTQVAPESSKETGDMEAKFTGKVTVTKLDGEVHAELTGLYDLVPGWFKKQGVNSKEDLNNLSEEEAGEIFRKYCNNV